MLKDIYEYEFSFTQAEVNSFAQITGDTNPLHIDETFAASTPFQKPIVHGIFSASIISKVLGTVYPGPGTIYLGQTLNFLRPVYPDEPCKLTVKLLSTDPKKHKAVFETLITHATTGKKLLTGEASVMNPTLF